MNKSKLYQSKTGVSFSKRKKEWVILLDHYLLCDVLFDRSTYERGDIDRVLYLVTSGEVKGYVTQIGFDEILALTRCFQSSDKVEEVRKLLLGSLSICKVDHKVMSEAILYREANLKAALDTVCQKMYQMDAIVTTSQDFGLIEQEISKSLPVYNPSDFLWHYYHSDSQTMQGENMLYQAHKLERSFQISPDAMIDAKPSVGNWILEDFSSECIQNQDARARVTLWNPEKRERVTEVAQAPGAFEALSKAFDKAVGFIGILPEQYELESIFDKNLEQGVGSRVVATSIIKYQNDFYKSSYTHRDSLKAKFYTYVFAVNNICKGEKCMTFKDTELSRRVKRV